MTEIEEELTETLHRRDNIIKKYRQALEEIREQYIHRIFFKCDKTEEECRCHDCILLGQLDRVQNIVKIIDEVLNDRD